jgi:hypothetical protein
MRREALAALCALLVGCSSSPPHFVKLDSSGKIDPSVNPETLQRDLAECKVEEANVRSEQGAVFNGSTVRGAFDNCMRSKGYLKG